MSSQLRFYGIMALLGLLSALYSPVTAAPGPCILEKIDKADEPREAPASEPAKQAGENPQNPNPPDAPQPAPPPKKKIYLYAGPDIGVFLPTSSRTRSRFGNTWLDVGVGIGAVKDFKRQGSLGPDLHILSQSANGNRLFIGLLGVEYRRPLLFGRPSRSHPGDAGNPPGGKGENPGDGDADKSNGSDPAQKKPVGFQRPPLLPYFGFSADLAVGDLRDVSDNIHSGVSTGAAGSVFLGVNFRNRAFVEARYRETTTIKSFDLSGLNLNAGFRIRF